VEIGKLLRPGKNTLEVTFDSPVLRAKKLEKEYGILNVALEPHRVYVRKAQYSFSWDWGPKLTTSGSGAASGSKDIPEGRLRGSFREGGFGQSSQSDSANRRGRRRYSRAPMQVRILVDGKDFVAERVVRSGENVCTSRSTSLHPSSGGRTDTAGSRCMRAVHPASG